MSQDSSQDNDAANLPNCEAVDFSTWLDALDAELSAALDAGLTVEVSLVEYDSFQVPQFNLAEELAKHERRRRSRRRRRH